MGLGGLDVIEPFPRTPCGMPIVPGELRVGQPRLGMRGRDWAGLVEKGMEITDSMCRAGEVGAVPRTGMLEDGGCLVDMTTRERRGKGVNLSLATSDIPGASCGELSQLRVTIVSRDHYAFSSYHHGTFPVLPVANLTRPTSQEPSLRLVPPAEQKSASLAATANSFGLHDTLQYGPRSIAAETKSRGDIEHRLSRVSSPLPVLLRVVHRDPVGGDAGQPQIDDAAQPVWGARTGTSAHGAQDRRCGKLARP